MLLDFTIIKYFWGKRAILEHFLKINFIQWIPKKSDKPSSEHAMKKSINRFALPDKWLYFQIGNLVWFSLIPHICFYFIILLLFSEMAP